MEDLVIPNRNVLSKGLTRPQSECYRNGVLIRGKGGWLLAFMSNGGITLDITVGWERLLMLQCLVLNRGLGYLVTD